MNNNLNTNLQEMKNSTQLQQISNFTQLQQLSDIVPLRTPLSVSISPTNICNIRCKYCYHGSEKKQQDIRNKTYTPMLLSEDHFWRIVSQLEEFEDPIKHITLAGLGEPLVNRDITKMIQTLKDRVAKTVKITSNALLLTHDYSEKLIESGLDILKVSLQGMNAEIYKKNMLCRYRL